MKTVLYKIWKLSSGLVIKEVGDRVVVFQFANIAEKDMVLVRQPWSFNKSLIVMKELDGFFSPDIVNMK
ncbi:hypothetical protein CRYUN_Cryun08bG0071400 [Craigia yunnanensis]